MSLKFPCPHCSYEIVEDCLKTEDIVRCPKCDGAVTIPGDAAATEEASNLKTYIPPPRPTEWELKDIIETGAYYLFANFILLAASPALAMLIGRLANLDLDHWPFDWKQPYHTYFWVCENLILDIFLIWIIYFVVVKKHHNLFFESLKIKRINLKQFLFYMAFGVGILILSIFIKYFLQLTSLRDIGREYQSENIFNYGYFFAVVRSITPLTASIFEEVLYRGFLFSGLKKSLGQSWAAILVSAFFIISHGSRVFNDPGYLAGHILFAVVIIWIRIRTDSVSKPIVVHLSNNLFVGILRWVRYLA